MTIAITPQPTKKTRAPIPDRAVYIADLAAYAAGHLVGTWIDLTTLPDADEVQARIQGMLGPHSEEWAIHDFTGMSARVAALIQGADDIAKLAEVLDTRPNEDDRLGALTVAVDYGVCQSVDSLDDLVRHGWHTYANREELAHCVMECHDLPQDGLTSLILFHVDWDAVGRDLVMDSSSYYEADDGTIYEFNM